MGSSFRVISTFQVSFLSRKFQLSLLGAGAGEKLHSVHTNLHLRDLSGASPILPSYLYLTHGPYPFNFLTLTFQ